MASGSGSRLLRPIYYYALAGVVAAVVLVSGGLQVTRTRSELLKIYEGTARTTAESVERLVGQALTLLEVSSRGFTAASETFALDDVLLDYLAGLATDMDQGLQETTTAPAKIADPEVSIQFIPPDKVKALRDPPAVDLVLSLMIGRENVAIRRMKPGQGGIGRLLVAFRRHLGPGFLILEVADENRLPLLKRLLLQEVVAVFRDRQDLLDLILVDENSHLLARLQDEGASHVPVPVGTSDTLSGLNSGMILTRHGERPALDFTKALYFRGGKVGILRLSLSVSGMETIVAESRRTTLFLSGILLAVGFLLVRLIFWRQEKTLVRIHEMEEEIRRREELSALGEMAAGVAHEIRNPLNAISMGLQSLSMGVRGKSGHGQDNDISGELLEMLRREVGRINRIVSEFLSVSRPANLQLTRLNPAKLVEHVFGILLQTAARQQVQVRVEILGSECLITGDWDKLTQALLNLGINALEACNGKGEITLRLTCQKDWIRIEVTDTGPGVAPEHRAQVFRPHFTTKEKGLGLGLFLAQRIVQAHGGSLTLVRDSHPGTTMVATLPLARD
jgi:signal transduction histidine kinase